MPEITKDTVQTLGKELTGVVRAWAEAKGLKLTKAGGSYDPALGQWTERLTIQAATVGGRPREQAEFEALCWRFNLTADHWKNRFRVQGTEYELVGLKQSRGRMPVIGARVPDGKRFVFELLVLNQIRPPTKGEEIVTLTS